MNRRSLLRTQEKLYLEIDEIRLELEHVNMCISQPKSDFELRHVRELLFEKYAKKNNQLVIVTHQIQKRAKKKEPIRQEKFFRS